MEFTPENVSDSLLCPICFHISKDKIFQCKGGHIVCDECYKKLNDCPQCRVALDGNNPIRNLLAEHLLDELVVDCPYKDKGCEKVLDRKSFHEHVKSCFERYELVNVCKQFGYTSCDYKIDPSNTKDTIEHFDRAHGVFIYLQGLRSQSLVTKLLLSPTPMEQTIIINRKDEGYAMIFFLSTTGRKDLKWASYYLFYGKEGTEPGKLQNATYTSEIKLVKVDEEDEWKEKEVLYGDVMMPKNILQIGQYAMEDCSKLLKIYTNMEKQSAFLRLIFNVKKL